MVHEINFDVMKSIILCRALSSTVVLECVVCKSIVLRVEDMSLEAPVSSTKFVSGPSGYLQSA
jgi:hypothetical protein